VFDTEAQAVGDDLAGRFIDEDRQPFHDGKGDIIQSHSVDNAIAFHAAIICPGEGDPSTLLRAAPSVYTSARSQTFADQRHSNPARRFAKTHAEQGS
jgi:hypothetical protein